MASKQGGPRHSESGVDQPSRALSLEDPRCLGDAMRPYHEGRAGICKQAHMNKLRLPPSSSRQSLLYSLAYRDLSDLILHRPAALLSSKALLQLYARVCVCVWRCQCTPFNARTQASHKHSRNHARTCLKVGKARFTALC